MLTNIQRIRVYALVIIIAVIIVGVIFNVISSRQLADVRLLQEVQVLSTALEQYKEELWRYPAGEHLDLRGDVILTENGFAPGNDIYYRGKMPSSKPVTYQSDQESYRLVFTLKRIWPEQGINSKRCQLSTNIILTCSDDI